MLRQLSFEKISFVTAQLIARRTLCVIFIEWNFGFKRIVSYRTEPSKTIIINSSRVGTSEDSVTFIAATNLKCKW